MTSPTRVRVSDEGGVRVLTITRPEKKNAFDIPQTSQMWAAIEAAAGDDSVRVVVVTAEGDYFRPSSSS